MKIQLSDHFSYFRLIKFVIPSVAMMVFTSIYGVVDGLFVSNLAGKTSFAAINLMMPFLMITATVGFIFGTGGSAIVARIFGEGKPEKANNLFSLFTYISFDIGILLAIIGIIFAGNIARFLGATEGKLLNDCVIYTRIIMVALPFYVLQLFFQTFFITAEKPHLGFLSTLASGITNIILDAVLVVLLPADLKLAGAAIATAASQVVGGVFPLIYFFRKNSSILRLSKCKYDGRSVIQACVNGSSEFMSNVSMNIVGMLYNHQLLKYAGEDGIAAYGVMMYVSFIFASVFIGYSIGTAPIVSYHYGAQNKAELKSLLCKSSTIICGLGVLMLITAQFLAQPFSSIFVGYDAALLSLTVYGFRIFALSFVFMGFAIYFSGFFTALNNGVVSAIISFLRTLVFQTSAVLILPLIFGINGIWSSIIIAEFMAVVIGVIFLIINRKKYGYLS